jgi:protein gp37
LKSRILANRNLPSDDEPNHKQHLSDPFYPRFWPERLKELQKTKSLRFGERKGNAARKRQRKPKGIFVGNMCEMFAEWIPSDWQREIFKAIRSNPQDRFYFLTKRPWNLTKCSPFPDNCWIGSTVCDTRTAYHAWWYYFSGRVKAKLKYLSFEPLLENVMEMPPAFGRSIVPKADWIIIGSQTKPYKPPKVEWVQAIVKCADKAGKPVFIKDNLRPLLGNDLRQELPEH